MFKLCYQIQTLFVTFQHNTPSGPPTHREFVFLFVVLSLQTSQENVVRVLQELLVLTGLTGAVNINIQKMFKKRMLSGLLFKSPSFIFQCLSIVCVKLLRVHHALAKHLMVA